MGGVLHPTHIHTRTLSITFSSFLIAITSVSGMSLLRIGWLCASWRSRPVRALGSVVEGSHFASAIRISRVPRWHTCISISSFPKLIRVLGALCPCTFRSARRSQIAYKKISPPRSECAGGGFSYGTCTSSMPAARRSRSPSRLA